MAVLAWLLLGVPLVLAVVVVLTMPLLTAVARAPRARPTSLRSARSAAWRRSPIGSVARPSPATTLGGAMIVFGTANQATQLMSSFKAGRVLGSSPRAVIIAQLLGCVVGAVVAVPVYEVLTSAYQLGSTALPAPAPMSWKATAEAVTGGAAAMPHLAPLAAGIGAALGSSWRSWGRRAARWLPSAPAVGIGLILPASYVVTIFLGGACIAALQWRRPAQVEAYGAVVAGGVPAGEALLGVAIAICRVTGFCESMLSS